MEPPIFSIITVVRNADTLLENTIQSVVQQPFLRKEYIVIDGLSTDNSLQIIQRYEKQLYWQSEKDNGIYDAMNKGLQKARGEWILFLNAGDTLQPDILTTIFNQNTLPTTDVLYGNCLINYPFMQRLSTPLPLTQLWREGMVFSHQAMLLRTDVARQFPFSTTYSITADYEQVVRLYLNKFQFTYTDTIFIQRIGGGISEQQIYRTLWQKTQVSYQYFQKPSIYYWFLQDIITRSMALLAKKIIPAAWVKALTALKYKIVRF